MEGLNGKHGNHGKSFNLYSMIVDLCLRLLVRHMISIIARF